ncbi:MAG: hypothetical protein AAF481_13120 [Acidobacteriota bacterium]
MLKSRSMFAILIALFVAITMAPVLVAEEAEGDTKGTAKVIPLDLEKNQSVDKVRCIVDCAGDGGDPEYDNPADDAGHCIDICEAICRAECEVIEQV